MNIYDSSVSCAPAQLFTLVLSGRLPGRFVCGSGLAGELTYVQWKFKEPIEWMCLPNPLPSGKLT